MYIKRVEIDGFKSYAQKQVVDNFDPMFNAITGLNGTGKSNILDSICFVLGITNLSCIRAGQMNDLVYKMGQAGINKATVTITFDNSNKQQTPFGYSGYNEIIVRRQVVVNGRNTYTINGTATPQGKVADFFRSVGLNVNNPHFLIMQGRITKVLNMKPVEILAMLEEAAGTKMYDAKRDQAVAMIQKKEIKVAEVNTALNRDILPTVERLKQDRANYLEWQKADRDIANLERKLTAYVYYQSKIEEEKCREAIVSLTDKLEASENQDTEYGRLITGLEEEYKDLEEKKSGKNKGEKSELDDRMKQMSSELAKTESERDAMKDEQKKKANEAARLAKTISQDKKDLESKRKDLVNLEQDKGGEEQKGVEAKDRVERSRAHLNAVMQGMTTDDSGKAITVEAQINQAKEQLEELTANIKAAQTREKHIRPLLEDKKKQLATLTRQADNEGGELDALRKERAKVEVDANNITFDEGHYDEVSQRVTRLQQQWQQAHGRLRDEKARSGARLEFLYNRKALSRDFDERKVYGFVLSHLSTREPKYNLAVEVAAGGQLWQVIVEEANVSKQMIDSRGCLGTRTTFIPLDKIQPRVLENKKVEAAKEIAARRGEQCWLALELIDFDRKLGKAMNYIFGSTVICESKETASAITYDAKCRCKTVTLEGDTYQPSGSGAGGSREQKASLIAMVMHLKEMERQLGEIERERGNAEAELRQLEPVRQRHEHAKHRLLEVTDRLRVLEENARTSPLQILKDEVAELEAELPELAARRNENQAKAKELHDKVKTYEDRKKNAKQFKEQEEKKAKKELKEAEAAYAALGAEVEKSKELLSARREEVAALEKQIAEQEEMVADVKRQTEDAVEELKRKEELVVEAKGRVKGIQDEVEKFRGQMRAHDENMKKMAAQIDKNKKNKLSETNKREEYRKEVEVNKGREKQYKKQYIDLLKKHVWLGDVEDQLSKEGTDFDFGNGYTYEGGKKEVDDLKERKEELGRKLNTKAMNILGTAEENVMSLLKKKEVLENDKQTILDTIAQLDEKKKAEVQSAYEQVTVDFGNIFSTLLPGTTAKLQPPSGKTALDGLEVKVAFNGKWKESLGELSGGQRSLVALSLVLAMLKFKPAPLYILDEVDAALDLSHTQNIGAMIKKHFTNSQFIIVSLKEGMFNNANVLFRTRFQDGTSQVQRFVNGD